MTAVKYHGEFPEGQVDDDGKPFIEQHGYTFTAGKSVDVKEDYLVENLAGNRFFEVAGKSDKGEVEGGKADAEAAETETLRSWLTEHQVPFHHKLGLAKLEGLKADYLAAQAEAAE